jgi:hypothetical protein
MRIAVCGHGRHGKCTVAKWLSENTPLRYTKSTSEAAAELVFSRLKDQYDYQSVSECWLDRANHREEWARIIWDYNQPDGVTLYEEVIADNDILDGIRDHVELQACRDRGIIRVALWVDASERLPAEGVGSFKVGKDDCELAVDNNHDLEHLYQQLEQIFKGLYD